MDNDNFSFLADAESSITGDKTEGYTPKEQELIHQLVQERLGKKNAIEFESLDDYVVPPKMFFSMIKKPAVSIRANRMEFSMSAIRLFEGVQHILPIYKDCNVEEEIVRSLDIERVRAALKALTPEERDIIMNFYFSENPLLGEALAEKFATTKSSIYRRRDHALRKLKSILGNA